MVKRLRLFITMTTTLEGIHAIAPVELKAHCKQLGYRQKAGLLNSQVSTTVT
jgi:hypothetical protein